MLLSTICSESLLVCPLRITSQRWFCLAIGYQKRASQQVLHSKAESYSLMMNSFSASYSMTSHHTICWKMVLGISTMPIAATSAPQSPRLPASTQMAMVNYCNHCFSMPTWPMLVRMHCNPCSAPLSFVQYDTAATGPSPFSPPINAHDEWKCNSYIASKWPL